jgi:hypothetical protein
MTPDIRDALIDALRPVCANPEVAADACLGVMERWAADEPESKNCATSPFANQEESQCG